MKNIKSLYDQHKYHDIVQILNPRLDPSVPLPSGTSYMYVWSLVRLYLLTPDFPEPNSKEILDKIVLFVDRYDSRNDKLRSIIRDKRALLSSKTSIILSTKNNKEPLAQGNSSRLYEINKNIAINRNISNNAEVQERSKQNNIFGEEEKGTKAKENMVLKVNENQNSFERWESDIRLNATKISNHNRVESQLARTTQEIKNESNIKQFESVNPLNSNKENPAVDTITNNAKEKSSNQEDKSIESDFLDYIIKLIDREIKKEELRIKNLCEDNENNINSNPIGFIQLKNIIDQKRKRVNELVEMKREPYFLKFEYAEKRDNKKRKTQIIGKKEFWTDFTYYIYDWRSKDFAMQNNVIEFAEKGIDYQVLLRRRYNIANGNLINYQDDYAYSQDLMFNQIIDPFLREVIIKKRGTKEITDIISTVQQHQYRIISDKRQNHRIVEGCAGSGKTMVLLHRLSYQAYNNDLYMNDHYLIVPSKTYLAQITKLMLKLDLINVKTCTIEEFYKILIKSTFPDVSYKTSNVTDNVQVFFDISRIQSMADIIDETLLHYAHYLIEDNDRKVIDDFESVYGGNTIGNDYRTNVKNLKYRLYEINEMAKRVNNTEDTIEQYNFLTSQLEKISKVTI